MTPSDQSDAFRDFGLLPTGKPPAQVVRAYFGFGRIIGQYLGTLVFVGIAAGLSALFGFVFPFPTISSPSSASAPLWAA